MEDENIYPHLEDAHSYIKDNLEKHNVKYGLQICENKTSTCEWSGASVKPHPVRVHAPLILHWYICIPENVYHQRL